MSDIASGLKAMMDRDARVSRATWVNSVAEKLLLRSGREFREAPEDARAQMMRKAFTAAEELVDEELRRFEAAKSPRPGPRAV